MPYRSCREFTEQLLAGDKLDCKVGDVTAGTFSVSDLPSNDAVLLLVIHRHDTLSTAVSFQSHVFANLLNPQVAIIDTYKGAAKSTPKVGRQNPRTKWKRKASKILCCCLRKEKRLPAEKYIKKKKKKKKGGGGGKKKKKKKKKKFW